MLSYKAVTGGGELIKNVIKDTAGGSGVGTVGAPSCCVVVGGVVLSDI